LPQVAETEASICKIYEFAEAAVVVVVVVVVVVEAVVEARLGLGVGGPMRAILCYPRAASPV